jgi:UDP-GlcNAc:undecaprenyl-phosphate/decaprenyl-phosphate GlcNAc-1-phosphate transferase
MTTILLTFFISLIISLLLTPLANKIGVKFGAMDIPDERKVHLSPIPRTGGLAIFVSFIMTIAIAAVFNTDVTNQIVFDRRILFLSAGAIITFSTGLFDDFHRLGPKIKFFFQIIGANFAFFGGVSVLKVAFFGYVIQSPVLNYGLTIFWFLLFINAVNLVDGLDGLAGGIVVFASMILVLLSIVNQQYLFALYFSILAGSVLGFLRYNFNPASIFLGDGGSYFLGYAIAGLSILGSVKSQAGAALAIPLLALGVPLFDTLLSPLRRFIRGQKMFYPDNGHVHHRLIGLGLTTRKAVLIIYGITFSLCLLAIFATNLRDERAGLFLIILGAGVVIFVRKLGYFEYLASDKFYGWFRDISDQAGFRHDRRSFLNYQIEISQSKSIDELWERLQKTAHFLEIEFIELKLLDTARKSLNNNIPMHEFTNGNTDPALMEWNSAMHIMLPLATPDKAFGSMAVSNDIVHSPLTPFTLRRIEQLRRTVLDALIKIDNTH